MVLASGLDAMVAEFRTVVDAGHLRTAPALFGLLQYPLAGRGAILEPDDVLDVIKS